MSTATPPTPPRGPKRTALQTQGPAEKAVARKAGQAVTGVGDNSEENVAEPDAQQAKFQADVRAKKAELEQAKKTNEAKKALLQRRDDEEKKRRQGQPGSGHGGHGDPEPPPPKETTKAGILAHNAAFAKKSVDNARERGFQQTPGLAEIIAGKSAPKTGESLGALLPETRMRSHPDLPEPELRPPMFLSPLEAMSDIYMRTRGRMSNKTKELLTGPDLEDLLAMIAKLFESDELVRKSEARLLHPIWSKLKDDPGPMLLGLNDPKLTEPWRLFLDRWEIWVPDDAERGGVELFWEGEAEDDDGEPMELLQSLTLQGGELTLYAKLGKSEDRITFDGEAFYRLKTQLPTKSKPE
ncbi:hypothetical protein L6R52_37780 [Myxococcota bacterium]|nr:hypothetical protein [Myxococcota bacterium]